MDQPLGQMDQPIPSEVPSEVPSEEPSEENLSDVMLLEKVNTIHTLCSENKINSSNAFDYDMTNYFHSLLRRKKCQGKINEENLCDKVDEYLESTTKIYGYRIDNVSETIMGLREVVKQSKKNDEDNHKSSEAMEVTDDNLENEPTDSPSI